MIRIVPTGDLGLDVLTGGGWRLVKRFEERESATIVVRGGAGSGKTLMGIQVALELARELNGDVAVGCIEILPTEYIAQLQSARPSLDASRIVQLPAHVGESKGPRVFVGLLQSLDPDAPDLVPNLEELADAVKIAGGKPVVFVVDSLIDGYGIGSSIDRIDADGVMKFAVQAGYGLVLCEEVATDSQSPWVFAADTVMQLGVESRERGRWIEVRKHRFGPSSTDRHELALSSPLHPEVFPNASAWVATFVPAILRAHRWVFDQVSSRGPNVTMKHPALSFPKPIHCAFAFVTSSDGAIARGLALSLLPIRSSSALDLLIEFDPLVHQAADLRSATFEVRYLPIALGPARALRALIERFGETFVRDTPNVQRILVGDLGSILATDNALAWVDAFRVFASLVSEAGWLIPVIAFDGQRIPTAARSVLLAYADVSIDLDITGGQATLTTTQRWPRTSQQQIASIGALRSFPDLGPLQFLAREGTPEIW